MAVTNTLIEYKIATESSLFIDIIFSTMGCSPEQNDLTSTTVSSSSGRHHENLHTTKTSAQDPHRLKLLIK